MTASNDSLSVLFTTSWYPSPKDPVLGNFVRRHAEAVATRHEVWLLYVTSENSKTPPERFSYDLQNGVHTITCYYSKTGISLLNRWRAFQRGLTFIRDQKSASFDVIHHNILWPDVWQALYLSRKWKIPFIVSEHWTGFDTSERGLPSKRILRLSRLAGRKAAFLCPVTENLATSMKALGIGVEENSVYKVVSNVVDTDFFVPARVEFTGSFRFLHLSNLLDPHKNVSGILRVWKKLTELRDDVHLTIAGDGPLDDHRLYSRELGIPEKNIQFVGTIPSEEVLKHMQNSQALILFSNYENFPCVISEAYSTGLPVISTNVGGIKEHLHNDQGYLIAKRDESSLLQTLIQFTAEHNRFESGALREYAIREFSVESIQQQFTSLYREAIRKKQ